MPHIHLEATPNATANLDLVLVLRELVKKLSSYESIEPASVKARFMEPAMWIMGDGAPKGYVHCTVCIQSGRPPELKQSIAEGMVGVLRVAFRRATDLHQANITLELREMDRETYQK
jgi:5-carboxymethyl-2-hydroxymuconate isomerase